MELPKSFDVKKIRPGKLQNQFEKDKSPRCTLDRKTIFISANLAFENFSGYSNQELLEKSCLDFLPENYQPQFLEELNQCIKFQETRTFSSYFSIRKGQTQAFVCELNYNRQEDVFYVQITDLLAEDMNLPTKEKKSEMDYYAYLPSNGQDIQYEEFFAISTDLLAIVDQDGGFVKLNKFWEHTLGYSHSELINQPLIDFIHPEDQELMQYHLREYPAEPSVESFVCRFRHKYGFYRRLSWRLSTKANGLTYSSAQDITDQRLAEEKVIKLRHQLKSQNTSKTSEVPVPPEVAELESAYQEVAEKQKFIESIAKALPAELSVYDNQEKKYIFTNHKLALILGYEWSEVEQITQDLLLVFVHSEDLSTLHECYERLSQGVPTSEKEIRLRHKEGYYKSVIISMIPLNPGNSQQFIVITQDISNLKEAESALKKLNQKLLEQNKELARQEEILKINNERLILQRENIEHTLEKLIESQALVEGIAKAIPAELFAFDLLNNKIVFSNNKFSDILNYSQDELDELGSALLEKLTHPDDLSILLDGRIKLLNEKLTTVEIRAKHKEGYYKWLFVSAVLLSDDERKSRYIVTMVQDITERKQTEKDLSEFNEKLIANQEILEHALNELGERNFELDQLVYKISHDLRSPLSTILGLVSIIKPETNREKSLEYVNYIENRVLKLDGFVKSMLNYAKANRTQMQVEVISFEDLIDNCLSDLEYLENFHKMKTTVQIDGSKDDFMSDALRLRIIFSNIISNAYKYQNQKSDEQNFLNINIKITLKKAHIEFIDNGIGIHEDYQQRIFEMFFRATDRSEGSGLGMYIVKQTVDKLKGNIHVKSKVGKGTSFFVEIPNLNPDKDKKRAK